MCLVLVRLSFFVSFAFLCVFVRFCAFLCVFVCRCAVLCDFCAFLCGLCVFFVRFGAFLFVFVGCAFVGCVLWFCCLSCLGLRSSFSVCVLRVRCAFCRVLLNGVSFYERFRFWSRRYQYDFKTFPAPNFAGGLMFLFGGTVFPRAK